MSIKSIKTGFTGISALAGNAPIGDFESIATVTVGSGGSSTITFENIPQTYTHLQFRIFMANTVAQLNDSLWRINDDTTSGNYYNLHQVRGNGSSASATALNTLGAYIAPAPYNNSTTSFTGAIVDILDYRNTNKNKTFRGLSGTDMNGSGDVIFRSGLWMSTSAITKIVITAVNNGFIQHSSFALYGIRG